MKTKEIRLNGKKYVLTLEEIHKINLIRKGLKVQEKIEPLTKELKEIKEELGGLAISRKGEGRMVRLDGIVAEALITWNKKILLDPEKAEEIKTILGKEEFNALFEMRTEFRPTKVFNSYTKGMATSEKAKNFRLKLIGALVVKETGPYVELKHKNPLK